MPAESDFKRFVENLRDGDNGAAVKVVDRFTRRLNGLAHKRLGPQIRQKVDPQDAVQSAFKSFFIRCRGGQYELSDWNSVWLLLARITLRKCRKHARYFNSQQRQLDRETSLHVLINESQDDRGLRSDDPTPQQRAAVRELLENLLSGLSPRDQEIVSLSIDGRVVTEISERVGCTQRTTQRVLRRVRALIQESLDE